MSDRENELPDALSQDELLQEAAAAWEPDVELAPNFTEATLARAGIAPVERHESGARAKEVVQDAKPTRTRVIGTYLLVAALVFGAVLPLGARYAGRLRTYDGSVLVADDAHSSETRAVGSRAIGVFKPGSKASFVTGSMFGDATDRVLLERGGAFFRVEPGSAFVVTTLHGNVEVTGTCFRVDVSERERADSMQATATTSTAPTNAPSRPGWFGAGAVSAALLTVVVYEGSVRVKNAHGDTAIALGAGESGSVHADGTLAQNPNAAAAYVEAPSVPNPRGAAAALASPPAASNPLQLSVLESEVARLRTVLERNAISPETGEPVGRRGLADEGNTDLTPEEWRTLAEKGELRYSIPGLDVDGVSREVVEARNLQPHETEQIKRTVEAAHDTLMQSVRELYREATGGDPGSMSLTSLVAEISDKTPRTAASHVRWLLSQERAGLQTPPSVTTDLIPYERMLRALVGFEGGLERELTELLGPNLAHELIHSEPGLSAHAYGMSGRQAPSSR